MSLTRRSALIVGVCSTLALSGSVVVAVGVPAEAETPAVSSSSADAAALVASRTSVLERATRAAARADAQKKARLATLRHQKVVADRAKRAAARKAAAAKAAQHRAAEADRARRAAAATASRSSVRSEAPSSGSTRDIGRRMAAERGWTGEQWTCLNNLWTRESGWRTTASGYSGAYGIPQALPGSKMASAGSDWRTNPATQIEWGLNYIEGRYGSPCGAWRSFQNKGWY